MRFFAVAAAAGALLLLPIGARADPPGDSVNPLLSLSLEQLMEVEITPINVLGSHTHLQGERMLGYRTMTLRMEGNRAGTRNVGTADVLGRYPLANTEMTMEMHMLEAMSAPSDRLSLMAMLPYLRMTMEHVDAENERFTTRSEGWGDLMLMALITLRGDPRRPGPRLLFNGGLSLPSGSINQRNPAPMGHEHHEHHGRQEYAMQLGSGTFDLHPGLTYLDEGENLAWGAQARATIRLGTNRHHYRLGNAEQISAWGYYKVSDWFGPSLRLSWLRRGNVHGADPQIDATVSPANDPNQQAARRLDLFAGANLYAPRGPLRGHRLTLEAGWPLYESVAGIQLQTKWQLTFGWNYTLR